MNKTALFGFVAAVSMLGVANVDSLSLGAAPANAVVYCEAVGIQRGFVARPAGAVVVHPVAHRPVVYCRPVDIPKGCVMR